MAKPASNSLRLAEQRETAKTLKNWANLAA
jgi:hypothetical protein